MAEPILMRQVSSWYSSQILALDLCFRKDRSTKRAVESIIIGVIYTGYTISDLVQKKLGGIALEKILKLTISKVRVNTERRSSIPSLKKPNPASSNLSREAFIPLCNDAHWHS